MAVARQHLSVCHPTRFRDTPARDVAIVVFSRPGARSYGRSHAPTFCGGALLLVSDGRAHCYRLWHRYTVVGLAGLKLCHAGYTGM